MNILLVDHACHRLTKSFLFLNRLLSKRFTTETFYYEQHGKCEIPPEKIQQAEWIVFLEFLPWRFRLGIPGKKCLFVPMYDNEWGSVWQWRRIAVANMYILSFSEHVTHHALKCGVKKENLLSVQFSPNPHAYQNMQGDPRKLLFWERGDFSFETVKKLFLPEDLTKVLVLRHPEEGINRNEISEEDKTAYKVTIQETGFLPDQEYKELISEYGLVIAPRFKEGIGMAFLEAMAMGKVVIAHNDGTMNEVIECGRNGWLLDLKHPKRLDIGSLQKIHATDVNRVEAYTRWCNDKQRILDFISSSKCTSFRSVVRTRQMIRFVFYLFEGLSMRFGSHFENPN